MRYPGEVDGRCLGKRPLNYMLATTYETTYQCPLDLCDFTAIIICRYAGAGVGAGAGADVM